MKPAGELEQISPLVRRLVAPNPGPMTGPGTNSYLIGHDSIAILDPGPALTPHIDQLIAAADGKAAVVVCTHTHPDHSPAAAIIARELAIPMAGAVTADDQHQDLTFVPDQVLRHDQLLTGTDWSLRAIHTPGHVDNHYCFLLEQEGLVFAGDHIMNGSTVVIIPPGGNMKDYIDSLRRLLDYPVSAIAPGHGEVIPDCRAEVEKLIRHRLLREAKVVGALQRMDAASLAELVPAVYDDVPPSLHPWAQLSLHAHLLKLEQERRVSVDGGDVWKLLN